MAFVYFTAYGVWRGNVAGVLVTAAPLVAGIGGMAALCSLVLSRWMGHGRVYLRGRVAGVAVVFLGIVLAAPLVGYVAVGPSLRDTAQMTVMLIVPAPFIALTLGSASGVAFIWMMKRNATP